MTSSSRRPFELEAVALTNGPRIEDVLHVDSDLDELRVTVRLRDPDSTVCIVFSDVCGYRVLDESQFLDEIGLRSGDSRGLWRVVGSGWLVQEPRRFMLLPSSRVEYFVCGDDDCVNVVSRSEPRIEVAEK